MAIDIPGGVSSAPPSEQHPVPSPEYADCSKIITAPGEDAVIGLDISKVNQSYDGASISFRFDSYWDGPQFTDDGIACGGIANYRGSLEMRSGRYAQKLPGGNYVLRHRADTPAIRGTIRKKVAADSEKMCNFAERARGRRMPSVRLVLRGERTLSMPGQPRVTSRESMQIGSLACDSSDNSGGVGPQRGDGTGGVSSKG